MTTETRGDRTRHYILMSQPSLSGSSPDESVTIQDQETRVEHARSGDEQTLAAELIRLARLHRRAGMLEQAVPIYQEALSIYHPGIQLVDDEVVSTNVKTMSPEQGHKLAFYTDELGELLRDLGWMEISLHFTSVAASIWRQILSVSPLAHLPAVATNAHNMGILFSHLNRDEQALTMSRVAVKMCRVFVELRPDSYGFLAKLAVSLHNHGVHQAALGLHEEALESILEAVRIAADNKIVFTVIPFSLMNLGYAFLSQGKVRQARQFYEQVLTIHEKLPDPDDDVINKLQKLLEAMAEN